VVTLEAVPLKPSQGQLDQMNAAIQKAATGKKTDQAPKAQHFVPASPNVIAAAPRAMPLPVTTVGAHAATQPAGVDEVGLILARAEKHE